ncbi:MAG: tetratricopeptide repeat protein [Gemmatimonadales bacterium]|nr:MAG: tetratricopeptide repeat protein [Gemmatimonadales bacterium]
MSEALEQEIRLLRARFWSERDPDGRAFAPLADAYLRKGEPQEALALVEDGLDRLPEFATGHLVAARIHLALDDRDAAREALLRLESLDEGNASALRLKGEMAEEEGDVHSAIRHFRRAFHLNPAWEDLEGRVARLELSDGQEEDVPGEIAAAGVGEAPESEFFFDAFSPEPPRDDGSTEGTGEERRPEVSDAVEPEDDVPGALPELSPGAAEPWALDDELPREDREEWAPLETDPDEVEVEPGVQEASRDDEPGTASGRDELESTVRDFAMESWDEEVPDASGLESDGDDAELDGSLPSLHDDPEPTPLEPAGDDIAPRGEGTATRTLGELYARQGETERAIEVFEQLLERSPGDDALALRLAELRAASTEDSADVLEEAPSPVVEGPAGEGIPGDQFQVEGDGLQVEDEAGASGIDSELEPDPALLDPFEAEDDDQASPSPFTWDEPLEEADAPRPGAGLAAGEAPPAPDQAGEEEVGPTAGDFFQDLLAWEPGAVPVESLAPDAGPEGGRTPAWLTPVPVESLAPRNEESVEDPEMESAEDVSRVAPEVASEDPGDGEGNGEADDLDDFQAWLRSLRS